MIAILLIAALIAYGSLYPWSFEPNPQASVLRLLNSIRYVMTPRLAGDSVANVLLYMPLGLAIYLRARESMGRLGGILVAIVCSFALSLSIEYAQFFQPRRFPTGSDVLTNTIGGALGVAAAGWWPHLAARLRAPSWPAMILGPVWVLSLLFPLIPAVGLWMLRHKLLAAVSFDLTMLLGGTLQWLLAGAILARQRPNLAGAALLLVPAQLFVAGRQPTLALMAGALVGSTIAIALRRPLAIASTAVTLLALWSLSPFRLGRQRPFTWMPFADAMENSHEGAIPVLLTKCFVYAGTILLIRRTGLGMYVSTAIVSGLLCLTEVCQMWIVGRTPASTDPVIAILVALMLGFLRLRL